MSLEGHVENGVVVFNEPVSLPNGTPVRVEILRAGATAEEQKASPPGHFLNHYKNVIGTVKDMPPHPAPAQGSSPHSILDIAPVSLGPALIPPTAHDDLLGEMLDDRP